MVSVSGFRSDGAKLALLHDRGFGDMSLLLLDVASGDAQRIRRRRATSRASAGRAMVARCWR